MSSKKCAIIATLCLLPTVALLSFVAYNDDCLEEHEAKIIFEQAIQLEKNGDIKDARQKYKVVDANACTNYKLRSDAFTKAVELQRLLNNEE